MSTFVLLSAPCNAQALKEVENKQIASILTFVEKLKQFSNQNMFVNAFVVGIPTDTVPNTNSEEIFKRLIISFSETGEGSRYKVYEFSKIMYPSDINFTSVDPHIQRIEFTHGQYKQRKVSVYEINIKTMNLYKIQ